MSKILLIAFLMLFFSSIYAQNRTIKEQMEIIKTQYKVKFVYDSSLDVDILYKGGEINQNNLEGTIKQLFSDSDMRWEIKGNYISLKKAKRYKLGGVIRDAKTKEPLIGVTVIERSTTNNGTYTNPQGFFSITLTEGKRTVECHYLNCETKIVEINISSDSLINIEMKPSVTELSEIVVVSNIDTKRIGELNLLAQKIKSIPAMFGESDVIKALQYIPGVQSSTEGKSDLVVRGGNPDQNLVLLDGIPIYNMNHVFGFFSIFNTDAIRGVSFYKSSFPARFGERLSSVVDIHTKEGNKEKFTGSASLGLLAAKLNLEIPIIKERTSLMLSARRSFLDLFMAEFQEPENIINFHFYDINAKLHHKFSDRASLSLIAYNGRDMLSNKYAPNNSSQNSSPIKSDITQHWTWGNTIASAQMEYIATAALALKGAFSYNRYHYNSLVDHTLTDDPNKTTQFNKLDYSSQIEDYSFKFGGDYALSNNHYIRFGGTATDSTRHTIELTESKPLFFERESEIFNIPPPEVKINGKIIPLDDEIKTTDKAIRYTFSADISDGDKVEFLSQTKRYGTVKATDILPRSVVIKEIETSWFQSSDLECLRANITLKDIKGEDNFYRVIIQTKKDESHNEWNGEWQTKEIFTDQEPLFSKIPITIEDNSLDLSYRIFSDGAFKDGSYTLNLYFKEEKMWAVNMPPFGPPIADDYVPIYDGQHYVSVEIQTISEPLYRYLHSLELQSNQDYTMDPIKIYSNVDGGYGVISSYNLTEKIEKVKY